MQATETGAGEGMMRQTFKRRIKPALIACLALGLGEHAYAQPTTLSVSDNNSKGTVEKLRSAGATDLERLGGTLLRARSQNGYTFTLIVPADGKQRANGEVIRDNLADSGFRKMEVVRGTKLVSGRLSGGQRVLAFDGIAAVAAGVSQNMLRDIDGLKRDLDQLGWRNYSEFQATFFVNREISRRTFVLISSQLFGDRNSTDLTEAEIHRFMDNGFSPTALTRTITVVRGELGRVKVIALVGPPLAPSDSGRD